MYDAAYRSEHQRARGVLRVSVRNRSGVTALDNLRQEGCLKARFPRPVDWTEIVTLNTSGGVAGSDVLDSRFVIGAGARATIASQAAERFYRVLPGDRSSQIRTSIVVGDDAAAEWLPQESILFDRCAVDRVLDVEIASSGTFLGIETLVFGRKSMGEVVAQGRVADTFRVRRGGELLLHDAIRMDGEIANMLARPAVANGGCAVATIVHVAQNSARLIDPLREALSGFEAGASAWNGMVVARIVADGGAALRAATVAGLRVLRDGRTLPRVWMC